MEGYVQPIDSQSAGGLAGSLQQWIVGSRCLPAFLSNSIYALESVALSRGNF